MIPHTTLQTYDYTRNFAVSGYIVVVTCFKILLLSWCQTLSLDFTLLTPYFTLLTPSYFRRHTSDVIPQTSYLRCHITSDVILQMSYFRGHNSQVIPQTSYFILRQTSYLRRHTSYYVRRHTSDVIFQTSYFRRHTSNLWIFRVFASKTSNASFFFACILYAQQTSLSLEGRVDKYTTLETITQPPLLIGSNGVVMCSGCWNDMLGYVIMSHR